ncbi:YxcD family protein [Brevibacillus daliensis]|uniref:YxcD family protein n=1 Tax=Brevibacillus daliensis TaxID=2892995 RepID=UPI001E28A294|nr:YxcD family protein [Brevibacillus daliensis]
MDTLIVDEQMIVNAICMYMAEKRGIEPASVSVELMWDEDYGFSAEIVANGRDQVLIESNLYEALRKYVSEQWQMNPYSTRVELILDDEQGIIARVSK